MFTGQNKEQAIQRVSKQLQYLEEIAEARAKAGVCEKCGQSLWIEELKQAKPKKHCKQCGTQYCDSCAYEGYNESKGEYTDAFCSSECFKRNLFIKSIAKYAAKVFGIIGIVILGILLAPLIASALIIVVNAVIVVVIEIAKVVLVAQTPLCDIDMQEMPQSLHSRLLSTLLLAINQDGYQGYYA